MRTTLELLPSATTRYELPVLEVKTANWTRLNASAVVSWWCKVSSTGTSGDNDAGSSSPARTKCEKKRATASCAE